MKEEEFVKSRFIDLSRRSYEKGIYCYTGFLTLAELSNFYECEKELYGSGYSVWGGYDGAERCMIGFGSEQSLGYEQSFPMVCVKIAPLQAKFADELNHRDYLGSLMNLGIERAEIGDILVCDKEAYVFVTEKQSGTVCAELSRIKHTSVMASVVEDAKYIPQPEYEEKRLQVKSERIDGIVAKNYNLSRSQAAELFGAKKVFTDGRLMENESRILKAGERVSVRGYGKFIYDGSMGVSKKGNLNVTVRNAR